MAITTLPYPNMDFVPLDVLTADELDHIVANIDAINNASIPTDSIADGAVTSGKVDWTTMKFAKFSTSEQETEFKWTDGKTIYMKTVSLGNLPNATTKTVAHSISNLDFFVKIEGFAYYPAPSNVYVPLPFIGSSTASSISLRVETTNVVVSCESDRSGAIGYAVLWYTKTAG